MTNNEKVFIFTAAVRGFRVYQRYWTPTEQESLTCSYEHQNPLICSPLKPRLLTETPLVICRKKFLGLANSFWTVVRQLRRSLHQRITVAFLWSFGPLGGLEIACKIIVRMPGTVRNHMLIDKYMVLVQGLYTELKNEVIMGSFLTQIHQPLTLSGKTSSGKSDEIFVK